MKVIAGTAKGTILKTPGGLKTRPTSGKVKAAFFNIIGEQVLNTCFLDLFSGTGGMGIEALSRGSSYSVFVEKERFCVKIIKDNLKKSRFLDKAAVLHNDAHVALKRLAKQGFTFDVIYIDPPYIYRAISKLIADLDKFNLLVPGGVLGVERDSREPIEGIHFLPYSFWQKKRYGNTQLLLFHNVLQK